MIETIMLERGTYDKHQAMLARLWLTPANLHRPLERRGRAVHGDIEADDISVLAVGVETHAAGEPTTNRR